MSRYIDADALAKKLTDWSTGTVEPIDWSDIAVAPSIDIVRCKECKRRKKNGFCLEHKRYEKNDNGYCSYGERKESK